MLQLTTLATGQMGYQNVLQLANMIHTLHNMGLE